MKTIYLALGLCVSAFSLPAFASSKTAFDPTILSAADSQSQIDNQKSSSDTATIKSLEKNGKRITTLNLSDYAKAVNEATWSRDMKVNSAMTVKIQALLDQHHASVGAIDGGWGTNSKHALKNFQRMHGLPSTGKMDEATWQVLSAGGVDAPILVSYTIVADDISKFAKLPTSVEARAKLGDLGYETLPEKLAERFHMRIDYLTKINPNKKFVVGETISVINTGEPLNRQITKLLVNLTDKTVEAYHGKDLIASYPATLGNTQKTLELGSYHITNKVKMPHYKATVTKNTTKTTHILPPGANSPVGVAWMSLDKPSYGIHGVSNPEIIGQLSAIGSIGLSNWDVLEVYGNLSDDVIVEIQ